MTRQPGFERRVWWIAGLAAVVGSISLTLLLSYRSPIEGAPPQLVKTSQNTEIGLTRLVQTSESNLVAAEAEFFDPTPLFLPTKWNTGQNVLPSNILRDPGQMFQDFPSRLVFVSEGLGLEFPNNTQIPDKSIDTIQILDSKIAFAGIGRGDALPAVLKERSGFMEITDVNGGKRVLTEILPPMILPTDNWHPLELIGVINRAGMVGQLSLVESSGVDEVDAIFRKYLAQTLHLGERLTPGFYRILVGP
ncbi:MAG: hypothetical protein K9M98_01275 [Cephaloticoccus sp.]|nr:hypothetical protein [Cephaloticoccus sp.]MCF7759109.1 hypothetical protein [Cephaloticoccus sp.]